MGNYIQADSTLIFHFVTLSVSWYALANIAIIAALFKNTILGFYTHAILTWIIICFSLISPLLYLVPLGIEGPCDPQQAQQQGQQCDQLQFTHNVVGTIIVCYIGIQAISGFLTRAFQQNPKFSAIAILRTKKYHRFSGYILIILAKFNCYIKWRELPAVWIPLVVWDVICLLIYIFLKWFSPSFEKSIIDKSVYDLNYNIKKIKNLDELQNEKLGYVIFANYVYDVSPLTTLHPAGYQIIKPARGRQVDRFLYGMYTSQGFSNISRFTHPQSSLKLLGDPIAKISIESIYSSMQQINQCQIVQSILISSKSDIYLFRFSLTGKSNLIYQGYSEVDQIGGYFSLSLKNATRLYTKVGCLRAQNINIMKKIIQNHPISMSLDLKNNKKGTNQILFKTSQNRNLNYQNSERDTLMKKQELLQAPLTSNNKLNISNNKQSFTIPLLIKIYPDGDLTPNLLRNQQKSIKISCQRGQGLQLDTLNPGKLIFIAGGTGFYPFIDLVDLLFKKCILKSNDIDQNIANNILRGDSIIKSNFLENFQFKFYIGVHSVQDLHPITLYQLNYLSTSKSIHCVFRLHESQQMNPEFQDFQLTKQLFHDVALQDIVNTKTSKTFICGPPIMLEAFADLFKQNSVERNRYEFI